MAKKVIQKGKKFWFPVIAPDILLNKEIGEVAAFEGKDLIGRCIELSYSVITNNPKDTSKKFVVKVSEIKGEKAHTEPVRIVYSDSFVQRVSKKYKDRLLMVEKVKLKDKSASIKLYLLSVVKLARPLRAQMQKKIREMLEDRLKNLNAAQLFEPVFVENLLKELKREVKPLFPIAMIKPWKIDLC